MQQKILCFNSTLVQLKEIYADHFRISQWGFNSTLVQLKVKPAMFLRCY